MRSILLICATAATPLAAEPFLALPIDCTLGETCFIEDYVDRNPAPRQSTDYACGLNTRDGHRGIDFALLSFDAVTEGVSVRAAADGTVRRVRDAMPDDRHMPGVTDQNACGNAVLISHENGYDTLYCHLRLGSVAVAPGQKIRQGSHLGYVGLSGRTTHPHLHLTVQKDGADIDPFHPDPEAPCGTATTSLWLDPPDYHATLIRLAGFAEQVPGYEALRSGSLRLDRATPDSDLVLYAEVGYAQSGDTLTITATGPDGQVIFTQTRDFENPRTSQLPAFGRRAPATGWPEGEYLGQFTLTRGGEIIANRFAHVTIAN